PTVGRHIPTLKVDLRLFGEVTGKRSGWRSECRGPSLMVLTIFALLSRFLLCGPDFLSPVKLVRKPFVGELAINVVTPSPPPRNGYFHDGDSMNGIIHPEHVLSNMALETGYLLARTTFTACCAKTVFARVERIIFSRDGQEKQSWVMDTLEPGKLPSFR
ncbi:MAG: hypothetical protein Q9181_007901, partial [Wetmoreana brouardii]